MDRLKFLRGLTRNAQDLSVRACDVEKRLKCLRALVCLAIRNDALPFSYNFPRVWLGEVKHVGEKMLETLEHVYNDKSISSVPVQGKCPSAAVAVLIALKNHESGGLGIVQLLDLVNPTLEFPFNKVLWEHDVVSCVSFDQVKILVSFQYIKGILKLI